MFMVWILDSSQAADWHQRWTSTSTGTYHSQGHDRVMYIDCKIALTGKLSTLR